MNEILNEGIIPLNTNFNQLKQQANKFIQNNINTKNGFDDWNDFNPNISINDPEFTAQLAAKKKRDEESAKQQKIANFTQYARNILNECYTAVNNLVRGNKRIGFNQTNAEILAASITNKINELLNTRKLQIDNNILLENCNAYKQSLITEYQQNIIRYKLKNTNSIGYNTESGMVIVNPIWLFEVISNWVNKNFSHQQEGDQLIYG